VDTPLLRTIASFRSLVDAAEASADRQPKAELARFQLQGLSATLGQLAPDGLPGEIAAGLDALRTYVESMGGADPAEGARLREKVQAYTLVADDLGLDLDELRELLRRWDATTTASRASGAGAARRSAAPRSGAGDRKASTGIADQECPVCGETFKRVAKHLSFAHPEEWARRKGA
jgi:hypothetical protein